jgi:anaerobic glycerol-3-phosphate dehydrogenase C subunit
MDKANDICRELKPLIKGEVFCDDIHRTLYSTAACIYQIDPLAVAYPKDKHDVAAIVKYCYEHAIPVIPRGAGSGVAGQAIGEGIILDLSVHMNGILHVDAQTGTVRVQPGLVLASLNKSLQPAGKFFAPDPSSGDYCTIGGMIANNASGARSLKYGATKDYVDSLEVVLSDGEIIEMRPLPSDSPELQDLRKKETHEAAIYTSMIGLLWRNKELITEYSPGVEKNSSGYDLKDAFANGTLDLTKVMVGSEGTLGIVTEATLRLVDSPKYSASLLLFFDELRKAGEAVLAARGFEPAGIEFMDEYFLRKAEEVFPDIKALVPHDAKAVLLVEFDGESETEPRAKAVDLEKHLVNDKGLATGGMHAFEKDQAERIWRVRKAAVPIVMKTTERKRAVPFIEDLVVPPEALPDFLMRLHAILAKYAVDAPAYGHAGDGNIHVRPILDLSCQDDITKMEDVAREVYDLTREMGGSSSGEHGDGLVRAPFLKDFSGPLYDLFFWTKKIFDPKGILNPGKKVSDAESICDNLRFGVSYKNVPTGTDFDDKKLIEEIEKCHGCGMCRSVLTSMCPVYKALGDERYTPRGKANLLRAVISGRLKASEVMADPEFREMIAMCYGCRMCFEECPTEVNVPLVATIAKAEIAKRFGMSLSDKVFCNFERVGFMGSLSAPLTNALMRLPPARAVMARLFGLSSARRMPAFNMGRFKPRRKSLLFHGKKRVVYFAGCFVNFMDARLGQSLVNLLEDADIEVVIPDLYCCGIPSISHGDITGARIRAEKNVAILAPFVSKGIPVISTCPSCTLALKEEYIWLLATKDAELVASGVHDATDYVMDLISSGELKAGALKSFPLAAYHFPCHLKALGVKPGFTDKIAEKLSIKLAQIEDSCCGIGGTFGFKGENFDISQTIGEPLFKSIKDSKALVVITECPTCKIQISQGTGVRVLHPVEVLEIAHLQQ